MVLGQVSGSHLSVEVGRAAHHHSVMVAYIRILLIFLSIFSTYHLTIVRKLLFKFEVLVMSVAQIQKKLNPSVWFGRST